LSRLRFSSGELAERCAGITRISIRPRAARSTVNEEARAAHADLLAMQPRRFGARAVLPAVRRVAARFEGAERVTRAKHRFDPSITCCCAGWGFGSVSMGIHSPPEAPPMRSRARPAVSSPPELAPQSPPPAQWHTLSPLEHFLALMFYCSPNVGFLQGVLSRLGYRGAATIL